MPHQTSMRAQLHSISVLNMARARIFALKGRCYGEDLTPQQERAIVRGTRGALLERQQELREELGNLDVTWVVM